MLAEEEDDSRAVSAADRTLRCSICSLDWPPRESYLTCPSCGEETTPFSHMVPMDDEEARKLKAYYDFETFYSRWDAARSPERLNPT